MTSEWGIESNPHKLEAVLGLAEPKCVKYIQWLNGCISTLGRIVSKLAEKCMLFFKALKLSGKTFQLKKNYTQAWNDLKDYLKKLPLLCAPTTGETLYIYLSVLEQTVASALIKEENK